MSENHSDSHHFIVPLKYYIGTFVGLLFLTVITVVAAQFDFGPLNLTVALVIAFLKASLVVAFFMGLRWEKGFNLIAFISGLLFFSIFIILTFSDIGFRQYRDPAEGQRHSLVSPVKMVNTSHDNHAGSDSKKDHH